MEEVEDGVKGWRAVVEYKRVPRTIWSTGCSEVRRSATAIGKRFQV